MSIVIDDFYKNIYYNLQVQDVLKVEITKYCFRECTLIYGDCKENFNAGNTLIYFSLIYSSSYTPLSDEVLMNFDTTSLMKSILKECLWMRDYEYLIEGITSVSVEGTENNKCSR